MSADHEGACDRCIGSAWLLRRLGGHLERARSRIELVLALPDEELIAAVGGREADALLEERNRLDPAEERDRADAAGLELLCRCQSRYPAGLRELSAPPAVLHVAGGLDRFLTLIAEDPVAIVGARRASQYGLDVAGALGRDLGSARVTVLSGMAHGIDSAAHAGALAAGAASVAVLAGPADRPYPVARRALHRQIIATGAAVSEVPPRTAIWRWAFPARNRIIAALAAMTVVVEAAEHSGALVTARLARELGRPLGAVPGRITSPQAAGANDLLAQGASVVRGPQDVLDVLFGGGVRAPAEDGRTELAPELRRLLAAIADGCDTAAGLARAGFAVDQGLLGVAALELSGYVRRGPGGRFSVKP